jgi:hypothetical protein
MSLTIGDEAPIMARIPLDQVTLGEAADIVEDASWFHETRIPLLFHFNVRIGEYWELTVGDHREMVEYLIKRGLIGHKP